jgi:hypothetical protein
MNKSSTPKHPSILLQSLVNFVIPLIILTRFSSESQLGPTGGFLLALAFPIAFEIYNVVKYKKTSYMSLLVIGGIMVTGLIGLLGLNETWLALRRSVLYAFIAFVIIGGELLKRPILPMLLPHILDMQKVTDAAKDKGTLPALKRSITLSTYALFILFAAVALGSYILTRVIIDSRAGTHGFNTEYARLRVLTLPAISLPMFIGIVGVITYLLYRIEKLTGLETDSIIKKR